MTDFLTKIKQPTLARAMKLAKTMMASDFNLKKPVDFTAIFTKKQPAILAEIKFSSPSKGKIYHGDLNPIDIAKSYIEHGASALSVLTEPDFFDGDPEYIKHINQQFAHFPILCKDFILHEAQINQAFLNGASAVLLMVSFLTVDELARLYRHACSLGLTPLIEVHNITELEIALSLNPTVIGINNRNLHTLEIDLHTAKNLIQHVPKPIFTVCESGINNINQINELTSLGFHGFLIGSSLMQHRDPGQALKKLLSGDNAC